MNKYIEADKLIAEIERRKAILDKYKDTFDTAACCMQELEWMKTFISAHQQEQPGVDLKKELKNLLKSSDNGCSALDVARHFFELGLNARKEI